MSERSVDNPSSDVLQRAKQVISKYPPNYSTLLTNDGKSAVGLRSYNPLGMQIDRTGKFLYVVEISGCKKIDRYTLKLPVT